MINEEHVEAYQLDADRKRQEHKETLSPINKKALEKLETLSKELEELGVQFVCFSAIDSGVYKFCNAFKNRYENRFSPEAVKEASGFIKELVVPFANTVALFGDVLIVNKNDEVIYSTRKPLK